MPNRLRIFRSIDRGRPQREDCSPTLGYEPTARGGDGGVRECKPMSGLNDK